MIFFTGLPTHNLETEAEHLKPFKFIEKPCEFDVLRRAIREAFERNSTAGGSQA